MLPRWFRVVVAVEVAGVVLAGVLVAHLVTTGVRAAGSVVTWARPHLSAPSPPAVTTLAPAPAATPHPRAGVLPRGLGALLDRGTGAEYVGEWALVQLFEAVLRQQALGLLEAPPERPRGP